jgi:hypothetical protein
MTNTNDRLQFSIHAAIAIIRKIQIFCILFQIAKWMPGKTKCIFIKDNIMKSIFYNLHFLLSFLSGYSLLCAQFLYSHQCCHLSKEKEDMPRAP